LWTSASAQHGEEGHLAEFHMPAMVAASPAAPLAIGAPTPPRTAEQGGRGSRHKASGRSGWGGFPSAIERSR
jgi:hypothetical protein